MDEECGIPIGDRNVDLIVNDLVSIRNSETNDDEQFDSFWIGICKCKLI